MLEATRAQVQAELWEMKQRKAQAEAELKAAREKANNELLAARKKAQELAKAELDEAEREKKQISSNWHKLQLKQLFQIVTSVTPGDQQFKVALENGPFYNCMLLLLVCMTIP